MTFDDWTVGDDPLTKPRERELHEALHAGMSAERIDPQAIFANRRIELIEKAEAVSGRTVGGRVLDVGCGSGYLSAWLALNRPVEVVHALEATRSAVTELIPRTLAAAGVPEGLVRPTLGSFNSIPLKDHFDVVLTMGAMHHAHNLLHMLRQCFSALIPGGLLIGQEPSMPDETPNSAFAAKYASEEDFKGVATVRNDERTDQFYRMCEYKTALHHAGFEPLLADLASLHLEGFRTPNPKARSIPFMMIALRPEAPASSIPHVWA